METDNVKWFHLIRMYSVRMSTFRDKVAVVTGAGSGIGRAVTLELARQGAKLALSDLFPDGLSDTVVQVRQLGAEVISDHLDVSSKQQWIDYADKVVNYYGVVHQLYNIAGISATGTVLDLSFEDIEKVVNTNFWSVVYGTKTFLPHLIASRSGHVINMSSLEGLVALPYSTPYPATKFAVRGFTETLKFELDQARLPVKVSCIHPGGVRTPLVHNPNAVASKDQIIAQRKNKFESRLMNLSPEKAALIIIRGVSRNYPRILVGNDVRAIDIIQRVLAGWYYPFFNIGIKWIYR
jgi:NAD(P)-dependent dehydrogenase (short-subunit alcohol dehydrogenase family)